MWNFQFFFSKHILIFVTKKTHFIIFFFFILAWKLSLFFFFLSFFSSLTFPGLNQHFFPFPSTFNRLIKFPEALAPRKSLIKNEVFVPVWQIKRKAKSLYTELDCLDSFMNILTTAIFYSNCKSIIYTWVTKKIKKFWTIINFFW